MQGWIQRGQNKKFFLPKLEENWKIGNSIKFLGIWAMKKKGQFNEFLHFPFKMVLGIRPWQHVTLVEEILPVFGRKTSQKKYFFAWRKIQSSYLQKLNSISGFIFCYSSGIYLNTNFEWEGESPDWQSTILTKFSQNETSLASKFAEL